MNTAIARHLPQILRHEEVPAGIIRDKSELEIAARLGELPEWDLSDLYPAPDSSALEDDLAWLKKEGPRFASDYQGKLAKLSADDFLGCIRRYEKIQNVAGRLVSYAGLRYFQNTLDSERAKFYGDIQDQVTVATAPLVFFSLEINAIEEGHLDALMEENAELARYRPWFRRLRKLRPYQLSDELERFLHDQSVVGHAAWNRLFDEQTAALEFEVDGQTLNLEATLDLMTEKDRSRREAGARAMAGVFQQEIQLYSRIMNTIIKEKEIEDRWRGFSTPQLSRHLANDVEPEVVEALTDAVKECYGSISHRYYSLKARWLGLEKLEVWDRNAPLPEAPEELIEWERARAIVLEAYGEFSERMEAIARPFFEKGWIDAAVKPGKATGAFAHPTVTNVHPYILLNYLGKPRDVMTLAHELGHGVHQVLAAEQGELLASTPLTLAETASVFGEMLTFRKILAATEDRAQRKALLAAKVEDQINTVIRQIAFYDFESRMHEARRKGELTPDQFGAMWIEVQRESLGPAFDFMPGYENFWAYIPHFVHAPFYVYAYAFGDSLVNALYALYQEGHPDFVEKYFEMLKAGGSKHHSELLAPFGLDLSDPGFWKKGLGLISSFIDELEAMED